MAEWTKADLLAGKMTAEQAEKIFTDLNTPPEQRLPDARSPEERQFDAAFPVARPEEFTIRYNAIGDATPMSAEQTQFDTTARTWLSEAQFPREVGNSLVNAIGKVAQQTQRMTPDQLESYGFSEFAKLEKVHGDKLDERLRQAGLMVHDLDLKTPGLKNLLKSKGIGDNAMVANMLIAHAQIYHARRGAQGTR
jgi:hypothetical protein